MKNNFKKVMGIVLSISMLFLAGCAEKADEKPESKTETKASAEVDKSDPVHIEIDLENGKVMFADLYPHVAPISVENFVKLIEEHFFDGLIFHRCINGFMIQAGGYDKSFYDGNFNQKEAESIKGEFEANGVQNNLKHTKGVLSMARTQVPDSGSSQFFIMQSDTASLDGQYAAFGEITEGLDVVDEIAAGATKSIQGKITVDGQEYQQQMDDVPEEPVVIKTISIIEIEEEKNED